MHGCSVEVTGQPRRPLSIRASTASCSMRFSLRTMMSGAPSSSRRLRRLLRLITRRYRSFRSLVAKRPPSSYHRTDFGGMTGTTSADHTPGGCTATDGRILATSSRLMMRRALAGSLRSSAVSSRELLVEIQLREQLLDGLRAHAGTEVLVVLFTHVAVLSLGQDLLLHQRRVARIDYDIVCKVQDLLQYTRADIQDQAACGRDAPLKYQMCDTGAANSMCNLRSQRVLALRPQRQKFVADLALKAGNSCTFAAVALQSTWSVKDTARRTGHRVPAWRIGS